MTADGRSSDTHQSEQVEAGLDPASAAPAARASRLLAPLVPLADESPVKTRANWRWMFGTFLTGIAGIGLIGGALYAAFDGKSHLAMKPHFAPNELSTYSLASFSASPTTAGRKSDRAAAPQIGIAVKQVVQESTVTAVNGQEFIEVKPHMRIAASLTMSGSELTADLPAFDPLKLFSEAADQGSEEPRQAPAKSSGDIVVTLANLAPDGSSFEDSQRLDRDEAEALVRETLEANGAGARYGLTSQLASDGGGDILFMDGAAPVPAQSGAVTQAAYSNVTELEKSAVSVESSDVAHKSLTVARGDTLMSILMDNGATPQEAKAAAAAMTPIFAPSRLKEGNTVRMAFTESTEENRLHPVKISIFDEDSHVVTVGMVDGNPDGNMFAALDEVAALGEDEDTLQVAEKHDSAMPLYRSLFETGKRSGVPDEVLMQMVRIHSYDVDFKRPVQSGDSLEVFYIADDNEGHISGEPQVLYSALTVRGETKRFYRFRSPDDGNIDYYDEDGKSAKKFLIRKPINGGVLRSTFGMRKHPILGYRKMHTGVDWAARTGTPIVAAGNGIVEKADWSSGYGRYTVIRHANGYKSAYAHQSAFAKDLKEGMKVKQGQIIGYVGSTGLSTGPHLHYEIIVNGRFVDPMRIRVPRGRTLQGRMLAAFEKEKARIDYLIKQGGSATRVAEARITQ